MSRDYQQFCGLARALELVGGRWSMLIVRDLLVGPRRFTDLREGLPGIPTNVLSARLRELEEAGIVRRQAQPRPLTGVAYELTEYGLELEQAVIALGMWGVRSMKPRREGDFVSVHALSLGLRGMFQPDKARDHDCDYELRMNGQTLAVSIRDGAATFASQDPGTADVVVETDADTMYELLTGLLTVDDAIASQRAEVQGKKTDARRFFEIFRADPPIDAARAASVISNDKPRSSN